MSGEFTGQSSQHCTVAGRMTVIIGLGYSLWLLPFERIFPHIKCQDSVSLSPHFQIFFFHYLFTVIDTFSLSVRQSHP